jgi:hypothetical protein
MASASLTLSIPLDLYAALVRETQRTGESRNAVVRRALESALGKTAPVAETPPLQDSAQTRTSEESDTPVPDVPAETDYRSGSEGGQKEVVQQRPGARTTSPQRAPGAPRRSADAKAGVKPRMKT